MAKCPKCTDPNGKHPDSGSFIGKEIKDGKLVFRFHCVRCNEIFELEPVG